MNRLEIAVRVYLQDRERNIPRAFDVAEKILAEEARRLRLDEEARQTEIRRARALLHGSGSG